MKNQTLQYFHRLSAIKHFLISLFFSVVAYFAGQLFIKTSLCQFMFAWDVFCVVQIGISWYIFTRTTAAQTHQQANLEDESRGGTTLLVMVATLAGLLAVFLLLMNKGNTAENEVLQTTISFVGMFLSWFLVHTVFAVRYAHSFYGDGKGKAKSYPGGLSFPSDDQPDFLDFAYYSLVIGMTFQVSDVDITSKQMRRLTLLHSVISFMFNTFIVALTINAVANIGS
jgi:uncharacterized membrane protein